MNDPSTYWLTFTNVALGVVVLLCCLAVVIGVVQELAERHRRKAASVQLDREVSDLLSGYADTHSFRHPELGVTMADGGEQLKKKEER